MRKKPINKHFFDEESKEMWYILGVSYSRYSVSSTDDRNNWSSSSLNLLKIVQTTLESTHAIGKPGTRGSRNFQVRNLYLQNKLKELGLGVPRSKRVFPKDCNEQYLDHFIRGFFDGNVSCSSSIKKKEMRVSYPSVKFLQGLYLNLVTYTMIVGGRTVTQPLLTFLRKGDIIAIHDFIYRDREFIQKSGLYLPEKKDRFGIK